ncbi:uncharacterized protein LOC126818120 [Patella vulgata]|uniref:uncharacterized protein LOC126818120 n=1 Tax=Patella vulgata TaxID=6465 RepID=UPI0024A7D6B3|nr:uncharacterized protein LOC126818120 [Patella vulgata]
MIIFPRVRYHNHFITDGPVGCVDAGNASGWMNRDIFLQTMEHFVNIVKPTPDRPVLLLVDNHDSHLSVQMIEYAKSNGVVMLSFPPHCCHKLQPLDCSVFGRFKHHIAGVMDTWLRVHPVKTLTIYEIPGLLKEVWHKSFSYQNCVSGFRVAGILPVKPVIFSDKAFAPSTVTDKPYNNPSPSQVLNSSNPTQERQIIESHLLERGKVLVDVRGDGHCLLQAVNQSLLEQNICMTTQQISEKLMKEVETNIGFYQQFSIDDDDVFKQLKQYLFCKDYNTNTADMLLDGICNALGVQIDLHQLDANRNTCRRQHPPRNIEQAHLSIELALFGHGVGAQYVSVQTKVIDTVQLLDITFEPNPSPTTDGENGHTPHKTMSVDTLPFNSPPSIVRPLPKAPVSQQKLINRRRRHTAILTDTPVKDSLAAEEAMKTSKKSAAKKIKFSLDKTGVDKNNRKKVQKRKKNRIEISDSEEDDADVDCVVCGEPYSSIRPREKWVSCVVCQMWAHVLCTPQDTLAFTCQNCDSDDDI